MQELFIFCLPNNKCYKIIGNKKLFGIWEKQINNEFVFIENASTMEDVKIFLKSKGYEGY